MDISFGGVRLAQTFEVCLDEVLYLTISRGARGTLAAQEALSDASSLVRAF